MFSFLILISSIIIFFIVMENYSKPADSQSVKICWFYFLISSVSVVPEKRVLIASSKTNLSFCLIYPEVFQSFASNFSRIFIKTLASMPLPLLSHIELNITRSFCSSFL